MVELGDGHCFTLERDNTGSLEEGYGAPLLKGTQKDPIGSGLARFLSVPLQF